jgi:urease accessory protein
MAGMATHIPKKAAATTTTDTTMDMDTGTAIRTDTPLLSLLWLASPALPVGGFSYSEGLEAAVEAGVAAGEREAGDWLVDQLHLALARSDLPVLAQALAAWRAGDHERIAALNDWVLHTRETGELRQQTEQMGRSFVEWLKVVHPGISVAAPLLAYPIAWAAAAARSTATMRESLLASAFAWAENMVQAAVRAVPLGQSAGQRILGRLANEIPSAADRALAIGEEERQSFAPMLAILSARHENQYSRLFRS